MPELRTYSLSSRILNFALLLSLALCGWGCSTLKGSLPSAQEATLLAQQRRSIESKLLQGEYEDAFRATLSVLQDYGYVIETAEFDGGLIFAHTGTQGASQNDENENKKTATMSKDNITAVLEPYGAGRVKARITIMRHLEQMTNKGTIARDIRINNPQVIQRLFADIQKEIFIRQNLDK